MGKKTLAQRLRNVDRSPVHPHAVALVWHPYLLDKSVEVAQTIQRRGGTTTADQALSVLIRLLPEADE